MPVQERNRAIKDQAEAKTAPLAVPDGPTDPIQPPRTGGSIDAKSQESDTTASGDDDGKHRKHFVFFVIGAAILFGVLLVVGIIPRLHARPALRSEAGKQSAPPPVPVVYPVAAPAISTLTLPGSIEALQQTSITSRASGYVKQWLVDIGDNVRAGQVLAVLDTPDIAQNVAQARGQLLQAQAAMSEQQAQAAQAAASVIGAKKNADKQAAEVLQADADLQLALKTYQRWEDLAKQGAVAQQAADEKLAAYNNNKANVAALQAAKESADADIAAYQANYVSQQKNVAVAAAQVKSAEANLKLTLVSENFGKIRAPFAGVITSRTIDEGNLIGGGSGGSGSGGFNVASTSGSGMGIPTVTGTNGAANGSQSLMYNSTASSTTGGATSEGQPTGSSAASSTGGVPITGSAGGSSSSSGSSGSTVAQQNAAPAGGVSAGVATPPQASNATSTTSGLPAARQAYGLSSSPSSGSSSAAGQGGTALTPGTSLFTLARIDILRIEVSVPEAFAPNVRAGQRANLIVREYPNQQFVGTITRTSRSLDPASRTMLAEVQIKNVHKLLLPGMYAQVVLHLPEAGQPLLVPSSALISDSRGNLVATVGSDKKVHLLPVQVGRDYGQQIEIVGGLPATDVVIVNPSDATTEGTPATAKLSSTPDSPSSGPSNGIGNSGPAGKSAKAGGASASADLGTRVGGQDVPPPLTPMNLSASPPPPTPAGSKAGVGQSAK